jgi:hypothetical protein
MFVAGLGIGYVLGTRAGRERFDQMVAQARKAWESPTVQEAAGVIQAQANKLYDQGKQAVNMQMHRLNPRTSGGAHSADDSEGVRDEGWDATSRRSQFPADAF